ncbi:MAG: winged helix-turn-helix transcriptional regulator [Dehalococcoidia bacterium]|nr:winged helix-turn-helix transcriptional regulator [Dehalococcoidia bacterium]
MPEWLFLTNHAMVLSYIARHSRITALELANAIGITERATRKIIADMLEAGYISKKREGRRNRYRINPDLTLRHPSHGETAVGDLLQALGWKGRRRLRKS